MKLDILNQKFNFNEFDYIFYFASPILSTNLNIKIMKNILKILY